MSLLADLRRGDAQVLTVLSNIAALPSNAELSSLITTTLKTQKLNVFDGPKLAMLQKNPVFMHTCACMVLTWDACSPVITAL